MPLTATENPTLRGCDVALINPPATVYQPTLMSRTDRSQGVHDGALCPLSGLSLVWMRLLSHLGGLLWGVAGVAGLCGRGPPRTRVATAGVRGNRTPRQCLFLRLCAVFLCLVVVASQPTQATLIASSKISYCANTGVDALNCAKKMVVTLTVEAGQQAGEESLVFINSAVDETAAAATVNFSPISITTSRSAVRYRYPLFYVQNYNAQPYEATVKGKLLNQCNADFNPDTATCGIAYDSTGKAIPLSQGFCCDCSMCQTLGFCQPDARANKACNIFDAFTTASCLRFGQRWYSGYTIGAYITWFTLNVTVARNTSTAAAGAGTGAAATVVQEKVVLRLSPAVLGDTAGEGWGAEARLVGSFAPTDQPLDLTSRMLLAPALPSTDERVTAGAAEWMLLPTTLVTLDGTECNKVGVSYAAFASQGNKCNLSPGSCLGSQLEDFRTSDAARVAAGKKAQYMATGYGDFDLERLADTASAGKTSPYISYVASSPAATMVVLTVNADDLEYIVGVATGKIVSAGMNAAAIEASTTDGVMTVVVENVAAVTGRLVVSVQNCTDGVFPMAAQTLSLAALQQSSLRFNVYMQNSLANGTANCTVVVRNAEEVVTDFRVVNWTVTATGFNNGTQGGTAGGGGTGGTTEESSAATCGTCGTLNIVCAVQRSCWSLILLDIVVYLIIAAVVFCVFWFRRIFCCCLYREGKQTHHHRHRSRSRSSSRSRHRHRRESSGGRGHSPTRPESSDDDGASRRGRSHRLRRNSGAGSPLPSCRGRGRSRSPGGDVLRETAVLPRPPPMTYVAAAAYPSLVPSYPGGGSYAASFPPSFASPLRVQPPSLLPPVPPSQNGYGCEARTPAGCFSPPAFYPTPPGSFAFVPASPHALSPPPAMSWGLGNQGELQSPASMSPRAQSLPGRGDDNDDLHHARERTLRHHVQSDINTTSDARAFRRSRRTTPSRSPSAVRRERTSFA